MDVFNNLKSFCPYLNITKKVNNALSSSIVPVFIVIVEWGGLEAPLSFKMTQ